MLIVWVGVDRISDVVERAIFRWADHGVGAIFALGFPPGCDFAERCPRCYRLGLRRSGLRFSVFDRQLGCGLRFAEGRRLVGKGCAVAYTDKGAGTDYFDLDEQQGAREDGTVGALAPMRWPSRPTRRSVPAGWR